MAFVNVEFNGIWRRYLGISRVEIEAELLSDLISKLETTYGVKLLDELKSRGFNLSGNMLSKSIVLLSHQGTRFIKDKQLNNGDLIQIFPYAMGG